MKENWRETFLLYSQTEQYRKRVEEAKSAIRIALKVHNESYCTFSGGKDSLVMLHLVLKEKPGIRVIHWDYGRYYIPLEYYIEILSIMEKLRAQYQIYTSIEYERLKRNAVNVLGREYLGKIVPELYGLGYRGSFIGLRKEESYKRRRRIKARKSLTKVCEYFPIADLTWLDIWAYIISNDLPYLSYYNKYAPVVGWDKVRFSTLFDPEFDKLGCSNLQGVLSWRFKHY